MPLDHRGVDWHLLGVRVSDNSVDAVFLVDYFQVACKPPEIRASGECREKQGEAEGCRTLHDRKMVGCERAGAWFTGELRRSGSWHYPLIGWSKSSTGLQIGMLL